MGSKVVSEGLREVVGTHCAVDVSTIKRGICTDHIMILSISGHLYVETYSNITVIVMKTS